MKDVNESQPRHPKATAGGTFSSHGILTRSPLPTPPVPLPNSPSLSCSSEARELLASALLRGVGLIDSQDPQDQRSSVSNGFHPLYEVLEIEQVPNPRLNELGQSSVPLSTRFIIRAHPCGQK